jgi:hypothetical protein
LPLLASTPTIRSADGSAQPKKSVGLCLWFRSLRYYSILHAVLYRQIGVLSHADLRGPIKLTETLSFAVKHVGSSEDGIY